jgi:integrase
MAQTTATYNQNSRICDYQKIADRKIDLATDGLQPFIFKDITQNVSPENALTIAEYILAMKTETNVSDDYRSLLIKKLSLFSRFSKNKSFIHMGREDVLRYLDSCRKPDASDPLHKWIGTYNSGRTILIKFFKWLHHPNEDSKKRKIPAVIENIPMLKRREQSIYRPTDLWTVEDDLLFLKFCPSKRDKCYHAISRDTSCRPHEILKLRIKDVIFKNSWPGLPICRSFG